MIETPYLLFLGDAPDQLSAKVGQGIRDWRPENAVGQFRLPGCGADLRLTDMTLEEAQERISGEEHAGGRITGGASSLYRRTRRHESDKGRFVAVRNARQSTPRVADATSPSNRQVAKRTARVAETALR